jgi:hypothetical protein
MYIYGPPHLSDIGDVAAQAVHVDRRQVLPIQQHLKISHTARIRNMRNEGRARFVTIEI